MSDANDNQDKPEEKRFGILPHPAKTNNPADLNQEPKEGGGLQGGSANAYDLPGVYIPDAQIANSLEKPKSSDELKAEEAKLNS